jgi:D-glycero-D-manno-heptose 1,7-bisphosphate phosphatase
MARAAFLDRDGTLIDVVRDEETGTIGVAFHPDHLRLLPGVVDGLRLLSEAGFVFAIATNQPGPAKGQFSAHAVRRTNAALVELLGSHGIRIAAVKACMHHPDGGPGGDASLVGPCLCRKPRAGLLEELVVELRIDRTASWMIGDGPGDTEAGHRAGMRSALVFATNRCELCPLRPPPPEEARGARASEAAPPELPHAIALPQAHRRPDVVGPTLVEVARSILADS